MPAIKSGSEKSKEIKIRRRQVRRLWLRKVSIEEIAEQLNVSEKTVDRDLSQVRSESHQRLQKDVELQGNIQLVVEEHLMALDELMREMWVNYHKQGSPRTKVSILKILKDTYVDKLETLQSLGLVPSSKIEVELLQSQVDQNPNLERMNSDFNAFIKHKYQDPIN